MLSQVKAQLLDNELQCIGTKMKYLLVVFSRDNKASLNLVKSSIDMVLFDFFSGIWPVNFIFLVGFE